MGAGITGADPIFRLTSGSSTVRVTSQFDKTADTALTDVPGLTFAVSPGTTYFFEATLFVTSDSTGASTYAIGGTCTVTGIIYDVLAYNTANNFLLGRALTLGSGISKGSAAQTTYHVHIVGTVTINAAGNLTVKFAQTNANGTSSVLTGSSFTIYAVP